MSTHVALVISSMLVALFGVVSTLMIKESPENKGAKIYFVSFFIVSLFTVLLVSHIPHFQSRIEPLALDISVGLNTLTISLGIAIRFRRFLIKRLILLFGFGYLLYLLNGEYIVIGGPLLIAATHLLAIWCLIFRKPKPNLADLCLAITMGIWVATMILVIPLMGLSTDREGYYEEASLLNLVSLPAYLCGVGIFLLTSYMMDANVLFERLASKDALTDMLNRRALLEQMSSQVSYLKRKKSPATLILADIDHFKNINDSYGHEAGDDAIKEFASIIMENIRDYDIAARYGGEEFLIFLPGSPLNSGVEVAERIRALCAKQPINYQGVEISVTSSFGVTAYNFDEPSNVSIAEADKALYQAKETGRNKVCSA